MLVGNYLLTRTRTYETISLGREQLDSSKPQGKRNSKPSPPKFFEGSKKNP